jgi:hypothetical protein
MRCTDAGERLRYGILDPKNPLGYFQKPSLSLSGTLNAFGYDMRFASD